MNTYCKVYLEHEGTITDLYFVLDKIEDGNLHGTVLKINSLNKAEALKGISKVGNYVAFYSKYVSLIKDPKIITELEKLMVFQ